MVQVGKMFAAVSAAVWFGIAPNFTQAYAYGALDAFSKAQTYSGYIIDTEAETYVGTVQVKTAKAKTKSYYGYGYATSKTTVTIQILGEKKVSIKGQTYMTSYSGEDPGLYATTKDGKKLSLSFIINWDDGDWDWDDPYIEGIFGDPDYEFVYLDDGTSYIKGGYRIVGTMDGGKKKTYALNEGAAFYMDTEALAEMLGDDTYADYLPDGIEITTKKTKWVLPKAGKVVYSKKAGGIDESKLGENPSGLKLTFKSKDGTFKGSFKAYVDKKGKPKATTVSVSGFVVDGVGYGIATIKKVGSVPITIE
jgi:hypothetical protein